MDNEGTTAETLGGSLDASSKRTLVTLLGKIKNPKDKPAWDRFYLRYHSVIRNMARAYSLRHAPLVHEADLEDIVIDVMDQVSRQAGEFVSGRANGPSAVSWRRSHAAAASIFSVSGTAAPA